MYSLAVRSMHDELHGIGEFPTLDGRLHFARLSTSLPVTTTAQSLENILVTSEKEAERRRKDTNGDRMKLMFIDDWIVSGATRKQILQSLYHVGPNNFDTVFAVMCGFGADVTGTPRRGTTPWDNNPQMLGIDYTAGKPSQ